MLVYSRLLFPASKKSSYDDREHFFEKTDYSLDDVYRCLSFLDKHKENLQIWLNDHIKEIGEALGWTEIVELEEQHGAMEYTARKRFCDLLKTHTARRSFATNMYKTGASLNSIMAITGHSSEQQLKTYLKLDESEKAMLAAKESYFTKLRAIK